MKKLSRIAALLACLSVLALVFAGISAAQTPDGFVVTIIGSGNPQLSPREPILVLLCNTEINSFSLTVDQEQ